MPRRRSSLRPMSSKLSITASASAVDRRQVSGGRERGSRWAAAACATAHGSLSSFRAALRGRGAHPHHSWSLRAHLRSASLQFPILRTASGVTQQVSYGAAGEVNGRPPASGTKAGCSWATGEARTVSHSVAKRFLVVEACARRVARVSQREGGYWTLYASGVEPGICLWASAGWAAAARPGFWLPRARTGSLLLCREGIHQD